MIRCAWAVLVAIGLVIGATMTTVEAVQDPAQPKAKAKTKAKREALANRLEAAFDAAVEKARLKASEPGLIVAVVVRGQPLFQKAFGLANLEKNAPVGPKTTFELA